MTPTLEFNRIPEVVVPGKRLGRHLVHDSRSREYAYPNAVDPTKLSSVQHKRFVPVFDQGNLGSCTGNAAAGAMGTGEAYTHSIAVLPAGTNIDETLAVQLYSRATHLDSFPGAYQPDDTGSTGLAVAKALLELKLISGYQHALSTEAALNALEEAPVIVGVNWYSGFDNPDAAGRVTISGSVRGGHEFVLDQLDVENQLVGATNSWGTSWGNQGRFSFTWDDLDRLLSEQGDCTILVPATQPAPVPTPVPPTPASTPDADLAAKLHEWLDGKHPHFYHDLQAQARTWLADKGL